MTVIQHFVTFYSPGTFLAETDIQSIDSWNVAEAVKIAHSIYQRYKARPYGFRFSTRTRSSKDLDSHESARSSFYYLGGHVETLEMVEARGDPKEKILRENMRNNHFDRIIINDNSWRWIQPLYNNDIVLDVNLKEEIHG